MTTLFGVFAFGLSGALGMPVSRELMLKLGTLVDMTRRADPELFQQRIEPINPFAGKKFKHHRIGPMLKADLSQFGEIPLRLQREAKALDRKAHVAMLPAVAYLAGLGLWLVLR
jgi:hypothetical protein